jgi:hypothetical protein
MKSQELILVSSKQYPAHKDLITIEVGSMEVHLLVSAANYLKWYGLESNHILGCKKWMFVAIQRKPKTCNVNVWTTFRVVYLGIFLEFYSITTWIFFFWGRQLWLLSLSKKFRKTWWPQLPHHGMKFFPFSSRKEVHPNVHSWDYSPTKGVHRIICMGKILHLQNELHPGVHPFCWSVFRNHVDTIRLHGVWLVP